MEKKIVDRLSQAKVGDSVYCVWLWRRQSDGEPPHYTITGETKQSWILGREKFDKKDGRQRGSNFAAHIYGQLDWEEEQWRGKHRYKLGNAVQSVNDVAKLKEIAKLIGYDQGKE